MMEIDVTQVAAVAGGTFAGVTVVGWRILAWLKRNARGIMRDAMADEVQSQIVGHEAACKNYSRGRREGDK